jgi:hypothetical protein
MKVLNKSSLVGYGVPKVEINVKQVFMVFEMTKVTEWKEETIINNYKKY